MYLRGKGEGGREKGEGRKRKRKNKSMHTRSVIFNTFFLPSSQKQFLRLEKRNEMKGFLCSDFLWDLNS